MRLALTLAYLLAALVGITLSILSNGKAVLITPRSVATHVLGSLGWSSAVVYLYLSGADS